MIVVVCEKRETIKKIMKIWYFNKNIMQKKIIWYEVF